MAGRLQPREAKTLRSEARCERDGSGSPDRREVDFPSAKLSLVNHHHLGAFRRPLLPCSLFRRHGRSLAFLAVGAPSLGMHKVRHFSLPGGHHGRDRCPIMPGGAATPPAGERDLAALQVAAHGGTGAVDVLRLRADPQGQHPLGDEVDGRQPNGSIGLGSEPGEGWTRHLQKNRRAPRR